MMNVIKALDLDIVCSYRLQILIMKLVISQTPFQFLNKTYIEKRTKLLSLDQMQKNQLKIKQGRETDIGKNDNTEKLASRRNVDKEMTIPNRYNLQIIGY